LIGALLREKAMESNFAKIAFVSSLSHELRTPIHGARSQLELIREFTSPCQLEKMSPYLLASETCLDTLRDVLDDVLDFGKLSNNSASTSPEDLELIREKSLKEVDLEKLLEDVALATWVRKRRVDIVSRLITLLHSHE
jgi:signal transduction histidine kinase